MAQIECGKSGYGNLRFEAVLDDKDKEIEQGSESSAVMESRRF